MPEKPPEQDDDVLEEHKEDLAEHQERVEEIHSNAQVLKDAWQQTLDDMEALAEQREADGWDVTTIAAVDAGPIGRDTNDEDGEFGMEFVIPDNDTEAFDEKFAAGDFPKYDVYRAEVTGEAFVVVELLDPASENAIMLAGGYHLRDETMAAFAAREEGETYTYVRTLDGTRHGAFRHDEYEKFFPRAHDLPEDRADLGKF